jgi:hypothetical protein
MTNNVANYFFLALRRRIFSRSVLETDDHFFFICASTFISDPEAGGKGVALENHVMIRSKYRLMHPDLELIFCLP